MTTDKLAGIVVVALVIIFALNLLLPIFVTTYQPDAAISATFAALCGGAVAYLFTGKGKPKENGA